MAEDTRKNILEVDTVQSIDKTDTVLVNDNNSLKQVSVETLVSSGIPDQYVTESELTAKGYATTAAMNSAVGAKLDKNQGSSNSGKYLSVGSDGNVKLVDAPSSGGGIIEETDPTVPEWAKNPTKPTYTASEVGADAGGTAETKVSEHNVSDSAHNDIRLLIQGLTTRLNTLADSDDETLDQMSEIVTYIKSNKTLIDAITTQKVSVADIVDNLTTNVSNKPLSAAQGVVLKSLIDGITIPETLPNPQKLKFTGAVTAEYDGSTEQTVNIPESASAVPRQEMQNTNTTVTIEPNKLYIFPEMTSLTVTLGTPSDANVENEYHFFFTSGATATTLTLNDVLSDAYSIEANMKYEVSILEGVAYIKGVSMSET